MGGSDNSVSSQLPDVELVNCQDPVNLRHQLLLQRVHLDMCGHSLQEDQGGLYQERPDRLEDENDEEDGEAGVHIQLVLPVSFPHDDSGDDDDHRAESVSHDVQEDSSHVHLTGGASTSTMTVTMSMIMRVSVRVSCLALLLCPAVADLRDVVLLLLLGQVCEVAVGGP